MIIVLNNKTNFTKDEFLDYKNHLSQINYYHPLILCPSSCYLPFCQETTLGLGAQNVSKTNSKSATGEITAPQLKSLNVNYCLVGHSERRIHLNEDSNDISAKIKNLLAEDIIPILCIGENEEEYQNNKIKEVLLNDLKASFSAISYLDQQKIIIAYEPIWAIGTGKTATKEDANDAIKAIRDKICQIYGQNVAERVIIQYGGSVKSANAKELFEMSDIDGGLVGGASLKPDEFSKIVNYDK